jgi:hypothetical protein
LLGSVSLPPNISQSVVDAIPDTAGCYIFYGEHHAPLYIGKSISMRSRVMSHFQSALTVRKEMKLSQQAHHIEWIETSGELSALILETQLIKERMPRKNIKQRHDACIDEVSVAVHNLKLQTALQLSKVPIWPFAGAVAIKDGHSLLVINKWCYLGTANDHDELDDLTQSEDLDFDLDIYKIVKKAMAGSHKTHVMKLSSAPEATPSFDVLD